MPANEKPQPENPQFALANRLMARYIGALEIARTLQDEAAAAEGRADEAEGKAQRMEEMAHVDPMTGLYNSYRLQDDYEGLQHSQGVPNGEHERATDADPENVTDRHSLLVLDLDHFKAINDNGGHGRGNGVLRRVGATLKDNVRGNDLPVRLHGERGDEFAVLLPRTTSEQAAIVAEGLRKEIEAGGDITVSVGAAELDLHRSLEENLERVDAAIYEAKETGRNRVVRFEDLDVREPAA
jgi:diguanylate cyclase